MTAILLCAGFATRMHPLTKDSPKPLLEIGGKPVIDHLIRQILDLSTLDSICDSWFHSVVKDLALQ